MRGGSSGAAAGNPYPPYSGPMSAVLPSRDADELDWLAFEHAGVLTTGQAVAAVGTGGVRGRLRSGRWRAVCRGIVATTNGRLTPDQRLWVAVLAAGRGAVLAGATAAAEAGVRGLRAEPLHVLVPGGRKRPAARLSGLPIDMSAVVVHRTTVLPNAHLQVGRPHRTTTARSLVDAAAWARGDDEARVALAAGCQQRRVTPAELRAVVDDLPRVRRRRLILETVADLEGGAQALSEIDFLRLCRRYGLPSPDLQERRQDGDGRVRYLDAYWKEWGLHVEVDGAHHMDVRQWAADMRRQNEVWIAGDRILRFPAWLVRARPDEVAAQVRAALIAGGWVPKRRSR
jgi:very-short-patch-repair endonuclease